MRNSTTHIMRQLANNWTTRLLAMMLGLALAAQAAQALPGYGSQDSAPLQANQKPNQLKGVDMDYHLGDSVSKDLVFTNQDGERVKLGDMFDGKRPVVLQLGYYKCPMLCGLVFQGLDKVAGETSLKLGKDYQIVTVSIDPSETPTLARQKRSTIMNGMDVAKGETGWHFLVGEQHMIKRLADEVGFGFKWVPQQQQFAHPAVVVILSPDGKITRYLPGISYDEQTFRLSLVEASQGQVGSVVDQVLFTCLHYDPNVGTYSMTAMGMMRIGGALTVAVLAVVIVGFVWREHRRRARRQKDLAADAAAQG